MAQIGCEELDRLTRSLRECQLQTDINIDPQIETAVEDQPQHDVRHEESLTQIPRTLGEGISRGLLLLSWKRGYHCVSK